MSDKVEDTKISHQPDYEKTVARWEQTLREKYPTPEQRREDRAKQKKADSQS